MATIWARMSSVVIATGILSAGIAGFGQGPRPVRPAGAQSIEPAAKIVVNEPDPDRRELLTTLLALETQQYNAMSLRDENWNKRPEAFDEVKDQLDPGFRAITGWDDLLTRDQFLEILTQTRLNDAKLSDTQLVRIDEKAVILAYRLETKVADRHGGHESKERVASTWVRRGANWVKIFEQSTRAGDPIPKP